MAIASASLVAQEPNAGNGAVNVRQRALQVTSKDRMVLSRSSLARRPQAGYGDTFSRRPTVGGKPDRTFGAEHGTHGSHSAWCPAVQARSRPTRSPRRDPQTVRPASRFDRASVADSRASAGIGPPEPTPEIKREYGQFVEREIAQRTRSRSSSAGPSESCCGKSLAASISPMRITWLVFTSTTAIASSARSRPDRADLVPDPRDPNDPGKDRILSYMSWSARS